MNARRWLRFGVGAICAGVITTTPLVVHHTRVSEWDRSETAPRPVAAAEPTGVFIEGPLGLLRPYSLEVVNENGQEVVRIVEEQRNTTQVDVDKLAEKVREALKKRRKKR